MQKRLAVAPNVHCLKVERLKEVSPPSKPIELASYFGIGQRAVPPMRRDDAALVGERVLGTCLVCLVLPSDVGCLIAMVSYWHGRCRRLPVMLCVCDMAL